MRLARETGARVHFCHVSERAEIDVLRAAKAEGLPISVGVTPHHLYLTADDAARLGGYGHVRPPLKERDRHRRAVGRHRRRHGRRRRERPRTAHARGEGVGRPARRACPASRRRMPLLGLGVREGRIDAERLDQLVASGPQRVLRHRAAGGHAHDRRPRRQLGRRRAPAPDRARLVAVRRDARLGPRARGPHPWGGRVRRRARDRRGRGAAGTSRRAELLRPHVAAASAAGSGRGGRAGRTRADDRAACAAPTASGRSSRWPAPSGARRSRTARRPSGGVTLPTPLDPRRGLRQGRRLRIRSGRARGRRPRVATCCRAGASCRRSSGAVEFGSYTRQPRLGNSGPVVWRDDARRGARTTVSGCGTRAPRPPRPSSARDAPSSPAAWGVSLAVSPGVDDPDESAAQLRDAATSFERAFAGARHGVLDRGSARRQPGTRSTCRCPNTEDDPAGLQTADARAPPRAGRRRRRLGAALGQGRA